MGNSDSKDKDDTHDKAAKKENFLKEFRSENEIHCVDFMKIWLNYDKDRSGYLETKELEKFLHDLLESQAQKKGSKSAIYKKMIMETFDRNHDGKLELSEMASLLKVEENFLVQFHSGDKLTREEFEKIFKHYDNDNSGFIDSTQLMALLKDIWEKQGLNAAGKNLEAYHQAVLQAFDMPEADGKLAKPEVRMLLAKSL
eukprot:GHVU01006090.1.p1 GENE.GHVU01006090.1~~GHVU01006090.1.p1  ORF type:complete len:199 (+),score=43.30 GHVU01006090.1:194-790(+)